jgi:hypothetical protein
MLRRGWVKRNGRQVIAHTAIILGFVLAVIFVIEPLFDRLERVPGEARLQQLQLPPETGNIRYTVDSVRTDGRTVTEIDGWAFIGGYDVDLERSRTYLVLMSDTHTYVFDTFPRNRPDLTAHFGELGLDLDWAGFQLNIPLRAVSRGEYTMGIYIRNSDIEALQYTDMTLEF